MDRLVDFARTYNVHIHLVAHSKKPNDRRGEAIIPRRYDVMGSSYITNLAFNVIVVWRGNARKSLRSGGDDKRSRATVTRWCRQGRCRCPGGTWRYRWQSGMR